MISVCISTFNRKEYFHTLKQSLSELKGIDRCNVRIFDDCSTDYDLEFLKNEFPNAVIIRRPFNLGADYNMRQMFVDFLNTGDEICFIADSDLIFNPDIIEIIEKVMPDTDGIVSLYNSCFHNSRGNVKIKDIDFVEKLTVGAAGTFLNRENVQLIVENLPPSYTFDWDWCKYFVQNGKRILVSTNSYIQHIGGVGSNSNLALRTDIGVNFIPGSRFNYDIVLNFLVERLIKKDLFIKNSICITYYIVMIKRYYNRFRNEIFRIHT